MKGWNTNHVEAIKPNQSWRDLEEAKTERSRQSKGNWKKTYDIFVEDNKVEAWTLLDKRANYILQKTIRMQMEAWTLLDGGSQLYALLHEARVRGELILWSIEDDEIYISMVASIKDSTCSVQLQKKTSLKRSLKVFLVVHLDLWSYDKRKKWNL